MSKKDQIWTTFSCSVNIARHFRMCFKNTVSKLDLSHAYPQLILGVESKNYAILNTNKGLLTGGFKSCNL